ncbi:hypothetical protein ACH42_04190 [Endozoicomonas sp. (ex Bugula neritina AB1)]|nr:hypothetical protein ACH42_04190 [Endozoicomonas sp. (ex Bugula neritina AB1)]
MQPTPQHLQGNGYSSVNAERLCVLHACEAFFIFHLLNGPFSVIPLNTLSDSITLYQNDGLKTLKINHPVAEAAISLHGGHLFQFKPTGQEEIIWLSEKAEFNPQKAIRGGVPICWPWFGRIANPAHGFARISEWSLLDHQEDDDKVIVRLSLNDSEATRAVWPHAFYAVITFTISTTLSIQLDVKNTDSHTWCCSGALHSYFNVSNASDCYTHFHWRCG